MYPFYISCPEEVVNQPFDISRVDTASNEKVNYILSSTIINEIFLNYSAITQEKSQLNVLKNIIIPRFSQAIFSPKSDIINSKLIFHFYESLSNLFLERYKTYLSKVQILKSPQIDFSLQKTSNEGPETIEKLSDSIMHQIENYTINNSIHISFISSNLKSDNVLQIIKDNPKDSSILGDTFLWSIYNSNLDVLFKSFEKVFLLKDDDFNKFMMNQNIITFKNKNILYHQDILQSLIEITQNTLESNFVFNKNRLNFANPKTCTFAATPNFLLVFNSLVNTDQNMHYMKINLCINNMTEENRFIMTNKKITENFFVVSIGNDAVISDKSGNLYLHHHNCSVLDKFVSIKQGFFQHLPLPFTSDGHFIYSIHNKKEIGVYELDKVKNVLTLIKKIAINDNSGLSGAYSDGVISNELLQKACIITNGIVLQFIVQETVENTDYIHFVRVISLITGNHIRDFHFMLPFPIHSLSFDPITKRIWTLTVKEEKSVFHQFRYKGPEPFWLSKFDISTFSVSPKFTNHYEFVEILINYVHSIACQFFGSDFYNDDSIPDLLASISSEEIIDLIFILLNQPPNNLKYVQLLFIFLSFQFKYKKVKQEQIDSLYDSIKKYLRISNLFHFLALFVLNIAFNLSSEDTSRFFELIFKVFDKRIHDFDLFMNLLLRFEKTKIFPFVLDSANPVILHELFNQLSDGTISVAGINLLMSYQSSLFLNYTNIRQTKIKEIQKIEFIVLNYTSTVFFKALAFIKNVKSPLEFNNSPFLLVLKKLLMDLRLTSILAEFILSLLPILLKFLKEIPKLKLYNESVDNPFYLFYMFVFSLYVFCFKRMLSFSNIDVIKSHYSFLDVQMHNEKNVSEVFENKLNDEDFTSVVNTIYTKVPNPINKHLSLEEKEVEKIFFLSIIFKTNALEDIIQLNNKIKQNEKIQIPQSIRQIAQTIYRIRSNLRSKRQNGNQNDYLKLYNSYIKKSHFLLQFTSTKFELKEISDFLNGNVQVSQIIQEQIKLESVKKNLDLFIPMANSFITQELPTSLVYFFIMNIADSSDILSANEIVKKYVTINLKTSKELISNLLDQMSIMPPNAILSFICYLIFVLLASFKQEDIHDLIYETILDALTKLFKESQKLAKIVFKSCVSIICHLNNILQKEKLFVMTVEERDKLALMFGDFDLKNSMSFELCHSLFVGFSYHPLPYNFITQLFGYVGQPEFHHLSLLIFDYLQEFSENNQEKEFMSLFEQVLDIIGTVLCGSSSKDLLQIAIPTEKIEQIKNDRFIRTPTSQQACVLDLIQIIRRFIIQSKSNASRLILNHFKWISENFQPDNQQYMKHLYAMLSVMSNMFKIIRPYTIVKTVDNKTYFITSLDEEARQLKGLLLPISKEQLYRHELDISSNLKSFEIIPYNLSLLKNFELPFSLFKKAVNIEQKQSSYSLF